MGVATTHAHFETTSWTLVLSARQSPAALGALLELYWSPVYAYLRRSGYGRDDAAELTQDFIAEVMLRRDLIGRADPSQGRFRSFLKTSLRNFIVDQRRSRAARDGAHAPVALGEAALQAAEPGADADPADAYDRQWAKAVLTIALERVRSDCGRERLEAHWIAFERRVLVPGAQGGAPPSLESLAEEMGLGSADRVASMIFTVKRKLRSAIRQAVAETVSTPHDLDAEVAAVRRALCG